MKSVPPISAVLLDKDGTLVDFDRTWFAFARRMALEAADGQASLAEMKLRSIGYDFSARRFLPDSVFAAGTNEEVVDHLFAHLSARARAERLAEFNRLGALAGAGAVPVEGCVPAIGRLRRAGLLLGVATNDTTAGASATLMHLGISGMFESVLGYDAVVRPKPAPDMVLAFAEALCQPLHRIAMVGDNRHDLEAGRAAGAGLVVGVLSGNGTRQTLEPLADIVLDSIADLPTLLGHD